MLRLLVLLVEVEARLPGPGGGPGGVPPAARGARPRPPTSCSTAGSGSRMPAFEDVDERPEVALRGLPAGALVGPERADPWRRRRCGPSGCHDSGRSSAASNGRSGQVAREREQPHPRDEAQRRPEPRVGHRVDDVATHARHGADEAATNRRGRRARRATSAAVGALARRDELVQRGADPSGAPASASVPGRQAATGDSRPPRTHSGVGPGEARRRACAPRSATPPIHRGRRGWRPRSRGSSSRSEMSSRSRRNARTGCRRKRSSRSRPTVGASYGRPARAPGTGGGPARAQGGAGPGEVQRVEAPGRCPARAPTSRSCGRRRAAAGARPRSCRGHGPSACAPCGPPRRGARPRAPRAGAADWSARRGPSTSPRGCPRRRAARRAAAGGPRCAHRGRRPAGSRAVRSSPSRSMWRGKLPSSSPSRHTTRCGMERIGTSVHTVRCPVRKFARVGRPFSRSFMMRPDVVAAEDHRAGPTSSVGGLTHQLVEQRA